MNTVMVPKKVFNSMVEAYKKWEEFSEGFGDFVLSSQPDFLRKMRKAKKEHANRKFRDLDDLKRELD